MQKILFVSLGCDKNTVDSEKMIGLLAVNGFDITDNELDADIAVVNTCCFIGDAKEESINTIIELGALKEEGKLKYLIVTGCLAQRYASEIKSELPEVDAIIGTTSYDKIVDAINELERKFEDIDKNDCGSNAEQKFDNADTLCKVEIRDDINRLPVVNVPRIMTTPGHYDFLKIAEGCNKNCTYCIIPKVRGQFRSVPMEELIEEARLLTLKGCKEIILVAQETTLYGLDIYKKKMLPELIKKLCQLEKLQWLRILYMYPEEITEELVDTMASEPKVCAYFDLPIQHCNDRILKAMGRRTNKAELIEKIKLIREKIPNVILRTTLITGFPTETESEHQEMLDFVRDVKFDRLGCFTYSPEEGTVAATMDGQIDEDVKAKWRDEIMETQQSIAFDKAKEQIGKTFDVLIEGRLVGEDAYIGRTRLDAPNVDGYTFVSYDEELETGDMVKAKITASSGYDLIGEVIE